MEPIMSDHVIETFHLIIEWAAFGIELLAVAVIVGAVVILAVRRGTVRYLGKIRGLRELQEPTRQSLIAGIGADGRGRCGPNRDV